MQVIKNSVLWAVQQEASLEGMNDVFPKDLTACFCMKNIIAPAFAILPKEAV